MKRAIIAGSALIVILIAGWHLRCSRSLERLIREQAKQGFQLGSLLVESKDTTVPDLSVNPLTDIVVIRVKPPSQADWFADAVGAIAAASIMQGATESAEHEMILIARESLDLYAWAVPYRVRIVWGRATGNPAHGLFPTPIPSATPTVTTTPDIPPTPLPNVGASLSFNLPACGKHPLADAGPVDIGRMMSWECVDGVWALANRTFGWDVRGGFVDPEGRKAKFGEDHVTKAVPGFIVAPPKGETWQEVLVAKDFPALTAASNASERNDEVTLGALEELGRLFYVPVGTAVGVSHSIAGTEWRRVEIMDGPMKGRTGWIHAEVLRERGASPSNSNPRRSQRAAVGNPAPTRSSRGAYVSKDANGALHYSDAPAPGAQWVPAR